MKIYQLNDLNLFEVKLLQKPNIKKEIYNRFCINLSNHAKRIIKRKFN